jgi:hypothetical protein
VPFDNSIYGTPIYTSITACDFGSLSFFLRSHSLNTFLGVSRFVLGVICRKKVLNKSFNKPQNTNFIQCYTTFILHILDAVYRHERTSNKTLFEKAIFTQLVKNLSISYSDEPFGSVKNQRAHRGTRTWVHNRKPSCVRISSMTLLTPKSPVIVCRMSKSTVHTVKPLEAHTLRFNHLNNVWSRARIMKLVTLYREAHSRLTHFIMQICPTAGGRVQCLHSEKEMSCHFKIRWVTMYRWSI